MKGKDIFKSMIHKEVIKVPEWVTYIAHEERRIVGFEKEPKWRYNSWCEGGKWIILMEIK